jgi:hypothetical protein
MMDLILKSHCAVMRKADQMVKTEHKAQRRKLYHDIAVALEIEQELIRRACEKCPSGQGPCVTPPNV